MHRKESLAVGGLLALLALAGCGDAKFVGIGKCVQDGSVVWFALPNSEGSYDGITASNDKCP